MTPPSVSPGTDGRSARWSGQRQRRRAEFVDAALEAIAEHGHDVSIEQIAGKAGVGRTKLYKYFADTADLQAAIADRVVESINAELAPVWHPHGTPLEMITAAINAHIGWIREHNNLYRYLTVHAQSAGSHSAITDVRTAIATHLTRLFEHYLHTFELDTRMAEPIAYALVGMIDSTVSRWAENPNGIDRAELTSLLVHWVWQLLDASLRAGGVRLDPQTPLEVPPLDADTPGS